ncbi:MAG: ABC transporter permease [Patescibacteria group bacterium]
MRFFDYFRTAFKNLLRQKARTFLTILAIVVGAISVTIMLSLVLAGKAAFIGTMSANGGLTQIQVSPSSEIEGEDARWGGGNEPLTDATITSIKGISYVVDVTPVHDVGFSYMQLKGESKKFRANLSGYDPATKVMTMDVAAGRPLQAGDVAKVVVGSDTLRNLGYTSHPQDLIGKTLTFVNDPESGKKNYVTYTDADVTDPPKPDEKNFGGKEDAGEIHTYEAEIIGVSTAGGNAYMDNTSLEWVRQLTTRKRWDINKENSQQWEQQWKSLEEQMKQYNNSKTKMPDTLEAQRNQLMATQPQQEIVHESDITQNGYRSILVKVDDQNNVPAVAEAIKQLKLSTTTAQDQIDEMMKMFTIVSMILGGIGLIALFVAAIGVVNTMVMATYERTREIGVMRACGATRSTVRRLFTFEAALLGFWGGVIGLAISYGLSKVGNYILNRVATAQAVPLNNLITFPWWLIGGVIAFTTIVGLLAGLYPAIRAARMNPVDALRYE